jgi:hypothetical protein
VDGQPTDVPDGADDRIHMRDKDVTSDPRQRHVFAESRAKDDIGVIGFRERENPSLQHI